MSSVVLREWVYNESTTLTYRLNEHAARNSFPKRT